MPAGFSSSDGYSPLVERYADPAPVPRQALDQAYADAMRDKGRFAGFMKNFPVHVIEDDYAALTGCAHHLAALLPD